jgi:hypothetical protein
MVAYRVFNQMIFLLGICLSFRIQL